MSADIQEQVVAQQIEHLDFKPACDLWYQHQVTVFGFAIPMSRKTACRRPAAWTGSIPCCNSSVLACERCRADSGHDVFSCCGRHLPVSMITWSRI